MGKVIIDPTLRARLNGLEEQTLFCDEGGRVLGFFVPRVALDVPLSADEIERRRKEPGGSSLEEFWKRMESR